MEERKIPSLGEIQRTNFVLLGVAALLLLASDSAAAAAACLVGGAVVIANLYVLGLLGRVVVAVVAGGGRPALAAVAIPLKFILIASLVYLVFARSRIDGLGFGVGVSTQLIAIVTETARAAIRNRRVA